MNPEDEIEMMMTPDGVARLRALIDEANAQVNAQLDRVTAETGRVPEVREPTVPIPNLLQVEQPPMVEQPVFNAYRTLNAGNWGTWGGTFNTGTIPPRAAIGAEWPTRIQQALDYAFSRRFGPWHPFVYNTSIYPDHRALHVSMTAPFALRGFNFTYTEGIELPVELANFATPVTPGRIELNTHDRIMERIMPIDPNAPVTPVIPTPRSTVRTLEQHERYLELYAIRNGDRPFTPQEVGEWEILRRLSAYIHPPDARTRVKVKVKAQQGGYNAQTNWIISIRVILAGREWMEVGIPPFKSIKALIADSDLRFFPTSTRTPRRTTYQIAYAYEALEEGLRPQALADILKAWAVAKYSNSNLEGIGDSVIDDDSAALLRAQPATLEVGGKVYRLIPSGEVDVRPLITRVRARALAGVNVQADGIRNRAQVDARLVVNEAEQRAERVRAEAERLRERQGIQVPIWVRDSKRPHFWDGYNWNLELRISCKIDEIRVTVPWEGGVTLYWNPITLPGPRGDRAWYESHRMPVWLRLPPDGGGFDLNSVFMREYSVTHIRDYCCMSLQGLPTSLRNLDDVSVLQNILSRGMSIVNLNSPLSMGGYYPDFKDQIPPMVMRFFNLQVVFNGAIREGNPHTREDFRRIYPDVTWDREERVVREADTTFSLNDPRLIPPITATTANNGLAFTPEQRRVMVETGLALADDNGEGRDA